jgi:hypothetical protein
VQSLEQPRRTRFAKAFLERLRSLSGIDIKCKEIQAVFHYDVYVL